MMQLNLHACNVNDVDTLSALLENTGALSITLSDEHDDPILEPALGTTPLWPVVVIHALYNTDQEAEIAQQIIIHQQGNLRTSIEIIPEQDWVRVAVQDIKPQPIGKRLWICPSWFTPPEPTAVNLMLDPGLAFGTGSHATTYLCLTWLEQANLKAQHVIDYGCGSGILALAALLLGAHHAYAVDIDEQALLATHSNATNNNVTQDQLTIGLPDTLHTKTDVLIANILLTPLLALQDTFYALLKAEGTLVVSGLLADQVHSLITAYQGLFSHQDTMVHDGWALCVFKKEHQPPSTGNKET